MSKPHRSRMILVGTGLIIAAVLLIWLLLHLIRDPVRIDGFSASHTELGRPWIAHQEADVNGVVLPFQGKARPIASDTFDHSLREHLGRSANKPVVLYVSAAGVSDRNGGFLLPHNQGPIPSSTNWAARGSLFTLEKLVEVCRESPSKPKLILWDAGQIGSDRNLGVYANGFVQELKRVLAKSPNNLAILCSNAPGQTSLTSEFDGRSVFGYYVEMGLSGKAVGFDPGSNGVTVKALCEYVRNQVASWAKTHRDAHQTPELFGDLSMNFVLPRPTRPKTKASAAPPVGEVAESEAEKLVLTRLEQAWSRLEELRKRKPYRGAPLRWQRLRETALHAERHFRGGDFREAENILAGLPGSESEPSAGSTMDVSLAMVENGLADQPDEARGIAMRSASELIDEAVNQLVNVPSDATGQAEAEPPKAGPVPKKEEGPRDAPKGDVPKDAVPKKDAPRGLAPEKKAEPKAQGLVVRALNPRRKGDSPFAKLCVAGETDHPSYTEAQLVLWADTFVKRGPDRDAFKGTGPRSVLLERAVEVRRLAEKAAAADERVVRWIIPRVEAGDRRRRLAQDRLFAANTDTLMSAEDLLEQASEHYKRAIRIAEECREAWDLVEQLSADLPYYGEWKARSPGHPEDGLGLPFRNLLTWTSELAQLNHADLPKSDAEGESLTALDGHVDRLVEKSRAVRTALEALQEELQVQFEAERWREIDGILCVPTIPTAPRMRLLRKVRSRKVSKTMVDTEAATPSPADRSTGTTDVVGLIKGKSETIVEQRSRDREARIEASTVSVETTNDPRFWRHASCLAELEVGLMEIAGARPIDLEKLRASLKKAVGALPKPEADTEPAIRSFADFSEVVRDLRAQRLTAILGQEGQTSSAALEENDRAVRVLAMADARGLLAGTASLSSIRREALLTWHGRRLVEDFAPRHALGVLEKARAFRNSKELQAAVEGAKTLRGVRLTVELDPRKLVLNEQSDAPLTMVLGSIGELPEGEAVAFVSTVNSPALSIKEKVTKRSAIDGTLVPIKRGDSTQRVAYTVEREEARGVAMDVKIRPGAFYRGQISPADVAAAEASVRVQPGLEQIKVKMRQSHAEFVRLYGDQFKRHEEQGFLHPHTSLAFKLAITHSFLKPTTVWVKHWLEDLENLAVIHENVKLLPNELNEVVRGRVETDSDNIPTDRPKLMFVEIRLGNASGKVLFSDEYSFRQLLPSEYLRVKSGYNPINRQAFVNVTHLLSDRVNGPVELTVNIDGQPWTRRKLDRGQDEVWWRTYPQPPPVIPWTASVEGVVDAFADKIVTGAAPPAPGAAPKPPPE